MGITARFYTITLRCDGERHREPSLIMRVMRMRTEVGYHGDTKGQCIARARTAGWRIGYRRVPGGHVACDADGLRATESRTLCPACAPKRITVGQVRTLGSADLIDTERLSTEASRLAGRPVEVTKGDGVLEVTVGQPFGTEGRVPTAPTGLDRTADAGVENGEPTATFDNETEVDVYEPPGEHSVGRTMGGEVGLDGYVPTDAPLPDDINPDEVATADAAEDAARDAEDERRDTLGVLGGGDA